MRVKLVASLAVLLLSLVAVGHVAADDLSSPVGLWQAVDQKTGQPTGWFLISEQNGVYTGIIAKMYLKPGEDPNVVCGKCRDDRHDKPWLGLQIIRGMKPEGNNFFGGGTILDPRDGDIYDATMKLSPDGQTLTVRGFIGISLFGRNQYWTRLPDSDYSQLPASIQMANPPPNTPITDPGQSLPGQGSPGQGSPGQGSPGQAPPPRQ